MVLSRPLDPRLARGRVGTIIVCMTVDMELIPCYLIAPFLIFKKSTGNYEILKYRSGDFLIQRGSDLMVGYSFDLDLL